MDFEHFLKKYPLLHFIGNCYLFLDNPKRFNNDFQLMESIQHEIAHFIEIEDYRMMYKSFGLKPGSDKIITKRELRVIAIEHNFLITGIPVGNVENPFFNYKDANVNREYFKQQLLIYKTEFIYSEWERKYEILKSTYGKY